MEQLKLTLWEKQIELRQINVEEGATFLHCLAAPLLPLTISNIFLLVCGMILFSSDLKHIRLSLIHI